MNEQINNAMERKEVTYTGSIPKCPNCEQPTERRFIDRQTTAMYFIPVYDKNGKDTNIDRNINESTWHCYNCKNDYTTTGNHSDGFYYK